MVRPLLFAWFLNAPLAVATAASAQRADQDLGDALTQPLHDLSILRRDTPEVLQRAAVAPYAEGPTLADGALDCAAVASEIDALDTALGDDLDALAPHASLMAQARSGAGNAIVDAIGDLVELPYRSIIRRITGAERRDREGRQAEQAGMVRRAYLKGLSASDCAATPQLQAMAEPAPVTPLSDLELARLQLAAANVEAVPRPAPDAGATDGTTAPRFAEPLSDLELARMQLAAANAAAATRSTTSSASPAEIAPESAAAAARLSDLELARMQLAAANAAAAARTSELWSPPAERSPDDATS